MIHRAEQPAEIIDIQDDSTWQTLYSGLRAFVSTLIRDFSVPSWQGQESDVIEDIVQESMRKIIERIQKAEGGSATPIQSLKQISATIAYNTYRDYRRRDRRLSHLPAATHLNEAIGVEKELHPLESATEEIYQQEIFSCLAQDIALFPPKQKEALLIDLANRMYFTGKPTPLQSALHQAGIAIQTYRQPLPRDRVERYRYASILNHAYKRIKTIAQHKQYI